IKTLQTAAAHPLMQPNPTSYQIYLHQGEKDLNHWDTSNAILRGYKLYWHNKIWDWKATPAELDLDKDKPPEKRLTKNLTPLSKGITFKSKIRFQNLSAVELGALMMIFDLNGAKNAAYKIGMGKPLGFGSIKITPTLFIESADAYENIFDDNGWKNPYQKVDAAKYLDAFKKHVDTQNMTATWLKVMDELNAILDWQNKPAPDKIKSMSGDTKNGVDERFKQRTPLPTIFEVLK
ncbi:MAG: TIGR03986 family CRISPR-associated RAMP protein, partial [Selenomonadaceae bacterium]|nr:TIGR03986 family CRISPR-associated RAMP protein [Selenomonadaceae bacterium]